MINQKDFSSESKKIMDWIEQYFEKLESYPVKSKVAPKEIYNSIPATPPQESETLDAILKDMDEKIIPGITHWQHPNFHAYFPANSSVESMFAEFITAAIGAQCMIWETSPAAAELEERVLEWLRDSMGLPGDWEGTIQDSASSASLVAILTAREVSTNFESNLNGVPNNLRVYCSSQTHSSIEKGVAVSGIGTRNLVKIPVDDQMRLSAKALEKQIEEDLQNGLVPCCVVAAIGTTGTVAVDSLEEIGPLCAKHHIFLHVDAAYAGTALLLPEYRWMIKGIKFADSFVFNAHKWMFTNFDCSAYYVKDASALLKTFEVLPEYLKTKTRGLVNDYRDWGVPLGRRFRALKLWFVIRSFGIKEMQNRLRKHIELNNYFAEAIQSAPNFELVTEPILNFTCFRHVPSGMTEEEEEEEEEEELNTLNATLLEQINLEGKVFLSHTKVNGKYSLRMVIGQTYVERRHVDLALGVLFSAF